MDTKIITNPSEQDIDTLARALRNGELVSIPTETVYGLGANGLDSEAMDKIYAAKGRPSYIFICYVSYLLYLVVYIF